MAATHPQRPGFEDLLRQWSHPTTPDELKAKGATRLRSITLGRMVELFERAVNHTLLERSVAGADEAHEDFSEDARARFLELLGDKRERESDLAQRAASQLASLERELAQRRRAIAREEGELGAGADALDRDRARQLEALVHGLFADWSASTKPIGALERGVRELFVRELGKERERERGARLADHRREIDNLERRISKLTSLLGKTEEELQRVARMKEGDPGIASIFDAVQGLGSDEANREKKAALMGAIFEANVKLRGEMTAVGSGPGPAPQGARRSAS